MLDLYHGGWRGEPLGAGDFVLSVDEKTQLQIRSRRHSVEPPAPGRVMRVEHEYRRHGTCAYQAARDVHRAQLFGQVVERNTIETFDAFVATVMDTEPYASAERVFWILDNGTVHRGPAFRRPAHGPVAHPRPRPPAGPRQLAEPDRNLLLGASSEMGGGAASRWYTHC